MRLLFLLCLLAACEPQAPLNTHLFFNADNTPASIRDFNLPKGALRVDLPPNSFGEWLRNVKLKKDNTVYLFNRLKKSNQSAHVAVLDISVGQKDLQQCADAIIRLRAEYLWSIDAHEKVRFHATDGTLLDYGSWKRGYRWKLVDGRLLKNKTAAPSDARTTFDHYLDFVFMYSGTRSLAKELRPIPFSEILPGDVIVQAGSPGHAVIIMDVATTAAGKRQFLIAQSYMPAQDIHILRNPLLNGKQPWYSIPDGRKFYTPEWVFNTNDCKRFVD